MTGQSASRPRTWQVLINQAIGKVGAARPCRTLLDDQAIAGKLDIRQNRIDVLAAYLHVPCANTPGDGWSEARLSERSVKESESRSALTLAPKVFNKMFR